MNIKDFSPLKGNIVNYYVNDKDFKGTELFFSDSNDHLYIMLLRDNFIHYDVAYYKRIDGYYNGVDYDFRIDLTNEIQIVHTDIKNKTYTTIDPVVTGIPSVFFTKHPNEYSKMRPFYTEIIDPICTTYLLINSTDFIDIYLTNGYVNTLSNNDLIVGYNSLSNALNNVNYEYNFNFIDYSKYGQFAFDGYSIPNKIYSKSYLPILLDEGTYLSTIICRCDDSLTLNDTDDFFLYAPSFSAQTLMVYYVYIPSNTLRVYFDVGGNTFTKETTHINNCNQYFYFGGENPIDSISFTAKNSRIDVNNKNIIDFGKEKKVVNMNISHKIVQNTGFNVTEDDIFSLSKSPYLLTISSESEVYGTYYYSGTTLKIEEYILDEVNFTGYNTKSFGDRNIALNLTKKTINNRFTGFNSGYYS